MNQSKKIFIKTSILVDAAAYLVMLPLAIYIVFYHGNLMGDTFRYSGVILIFVVSLTIIHGFIFRYINLYKPLKLLLDYHKNDPIDYRQIKLQLLNFPRREAYSSSIKWIYGVSLVLGITNLFVPFDPKTYLIGLAAIAQSLLINYMNNYFIAERILADVLEEPRLSTILIRHDEYKPFSLMKKTIISMVGMTLTIYIITTFFWVDSFNQKISPSVLPYHITFVFFMLILIMVLTIYLRNFANKRSILKMYESISKMSKGELNADFSMISIDELGALSNYLYRFNLTLNNITNLIYHEVENIYHYSSNFLSDSSIESESIAEILNKNTFHNLFEVSDGLKQISAFLNTAIAAINKEKYLKDGQVLINNVLQRYTNKIELSNQVIKEIANYVNALVGALYILEDDNQFLLSGTYAYKSTEKVYQVGDGLVGQAALDQEIRVIENLPDDELLYIDTGLTTMRPKYMVVIPCVNNAITNAVIVLGSMHLISSNELELLETIQHGISLSISSILVNEKNSELLRQSQELTTELQQQHEELIETNSEMEQINEELEQQTHELREAEAAQEAQKLDLIEANDALNKVNNDLRKVQEELQLKADTLEKAYQYKSEFLANMSHELRTPLNSIIILSKMLLENKNHTLLNKEVEYSETIHNASNDLLDLINEILNLSKVEAGMMELNIQSLNLKDFFDDIKLGFDELASSKNLSFSIDIDKAIPLYIKTDEQRLKQIIKNLLSNAFKFTHSGDVTVHVTKGNGLIEIAVRDTGIGIKESDYDLIFKEFTQADGNINRKYGGTGLGLSISQKYAKLLGGEIKINSKLNEGSVFTLCIPYEDEDDTKTVESKNIIIESLNKESKKVLLITKENEKEFVEVIETQTFDYIKVNHYEDAYSILQNNLIKTIVIDATNNIDDAIKLIKDEKLSNQKCIFYSEQVDFQNHEEDIRKYADSIIINKGNFKKRFIYELNLYMTENNTSPIKDVYINQNDLLMNKKILIVDDDMRNVFALSSVLENHKATVVVGKNGKDGLNKLEKTDDIDLILMDIMMPEMDGYETMKEIRKESKYEHVPIIALTAKAMKEDRQKCLDAGANDYMPKPIDVDKLLSLIKVWLQNDK